MRSARLAAARPSPISHRGSSFEVDSVTEGEALRDALEQLAIVEMVQPDPELVGTQIVDPEEDNQRYLDVAPVGHGTEWAWPQPGGTGSRVTIAVIDSGFDTSHPDVDRADAPGVAIPHEPARDPRHGLQVLGILVADDDGAGIRGIAHDAGIRTINSGDTGADVARAIGLATAALGPGDVLSISQGIRAESGSDIVLPLVYSSAARDALRTAAAKGIITVVSAGNGGANLDAYADRLGNDSPATIVVGGGGSGSVPGCGGGTAGARVAVSNYGSRVDLQGWGECVRTTTTGNSYTWWGFTSAATPMVAGAGALAVVDVRGPAWRHPDGCAGPDDPAVHGSRSGGASHHRAAPRPAQRHGRRRRHARQRHVGPRRASARPAGAARPRHELRRRRARRTRSGVRAHDRHRLVPHRRPA